MPRPAKMGLSAKAKKALKEKQIIEDQLKREKEVHTEPIIFEEKIVDTHVPPKLQYRAPKAGNYQYSNGEIRYCEEGELMEYAPGPGSSITFIGGVPRDNGTYDILGVHGAEEKLPELDEYKIRDEMFPPPPNCQQSHIYTAMKVSNMFSELGVQLYYGCPHNVHLQRALLELQLAHEACNKAIMSDV